MSLNILNSLNNKQCSCNQEHVFESEVIIGKGAVNELLQVLEKMNVKKVYLVADQNTYSVAGEKVFEILTQSEVSVSKYVFASKNLEPDESAVGMATMNYRPGCDAVIGVGSGVINDICKIVAATANKPYIIVATAPSMDGYASATSSMTMSGLKISLPSKCAEVIIGDTDILCKAPIKMMISGLGDMIAKYVSICEWRISNLVTGEYYCEKIAQLVRDSLKKCVDHAEGLLKRDESAVTAVFEGLVVCGAAMKFAGISRPASGIEHYFSHVWDMRAVEFGTPADFHGIQCAVGTLLSIKLYEKIKSVTPDKIKATNYVQSFDFSAWSETLRAFLGKGAESMIALEGKEQKYNVEKHSERLNRLIEKWDEIQKIINEELPLLDEIDTFYDKVGLPKTMKEIGIDEADLSLSFKATKDIRDKYVLSRICWDLGIIDEICVTLCEEFE